MISRNTVERLFANYVEHPDPHLLVTIDGLIVSTNPSFDTAIQAPAEVWVGHRLSELVVSTTPPGADDVILQSVIAGKAGRFLGFISNAAPRFELTLLPLRTNNEISHILVSARSERHSEGSEGATLSNFTALSDLQLENLELHSWLDVFEPMFQNYRTPLSIRSINNIVERWNAASAATFGWPASEMVGKHIASVLHPDPHQFELAMAFLLAEDSWSGELEYRARDGRSVFIDAHWSLIRDSQGVPFRIFSTGSDITNSKAERDQQDRNRRFESLGTLAGGIAHDLNNALTPILLSSQLLLRSEHDARNVRLLRSIESSAIHGANLIKRVLQFARGAESKNYVLDVGALIRNIAETVTENLPETVTIETQIDDRVLAVLADTTQLQQVVLNLISNARDAMPNGGRMVIRAFGDPAAIPEIDNGNGNGNGNNVPRSPPISMVNVEVEDSGSGIALDVMERIFDPFFTTKAVGDGTGLGLSSSLTIVKNLRGKLWASNYSVATTRAATGATFHLSLPAASESTTSPVQEQDRAQGTSSDSSSRDRRQPGDNATEDTPNPDSGPGVRRVVLVVDDDEGILEITMGILREAGHDTVSAVNGEQAISYIETGSQVDLVLTDIAMPVLDGIALSRYVRTKRPDTGLITMSGQYRPAEAAPSLAGVAHLIKPFSTTQLLDSVSVALNTGVNNA